MLFLLSSSPLYAVARAAFRHGFPSSTPPRPLEWVGNRSHGTFLSSIPVRCRLPASSSGRCASKVFDTSRGRVRLPTQATPFSQRFAVRASSIRGIPPAPSVLLRNLQGRFPPSLTTPLLSFGERPRRVSYAGPACVPLPVQAVSRS